VDPHATEWLHLIARWTHIIAAIAWIGHAFLFTELEHALVRPEDDDDRKGLVGELWMVHGGGFFHLEKSFGWPRLRGELLWFRWESAMTWLSGVALLWLIFWTGGGVYLIDPTVADLSMAQALGISVGTLGIGWVVYSVLCRTPLLDRPLPFGLVYGAFVVGMGYALTHLISGRAAFLHVGAMIATVMVANVWMVIIPRMRRMVADAQRVGMLDARLGYQAKQRSLHNHYFTYPVIFLMLSNHFPAVYGHEHAWLLLALISLLGVVVKWVMNVRGERMGPRLAVLVGVLGAFGITGYGKLGVGEDDAPAPPPSADARPIDPATTGRITGVVRLEGEAPPRDEIRLFNGCESDVPVLSERVVARDGMLANAFIQLRAGWEGWAVPPPPDQPVIIDQIGCIYLPHVAGARVGQTVRYLNSDPLPHNVRAIASANATFNDMMMAGAPPLEKVFRRPETMVTAKCDIHPWMAGYLGVVPHPWFAVSGEDGRFTLPDVPPGTYTVAAWHEALGEQVAEVVVPPSGTAELTFTFAPR
jgi:uncharacterized membrane protein